jgi:hypothetical protein
MLPRTTRLRFVKAKKPETLQAFCDKLDKRIEVKSIVKDGEFWFLWFIPDDKRNDIQSGQLKEVETKKDIKK